MSRTATIYLIGGDYPERLDALATAAAAARSDTTPLLASEQHPYEVLREDYTALKSEAEVEASENGRCVTLRAPSRKEWRALKVTHPPRVGTEYDAETVKGDRISGVNTDSVEDDLVHVSLTEPTDKACAGDVRIPGQACSSENPCANRVAFDEWANALSEAEFRTLLLRSFELGQVAKVDPKSLPPLPTRSSDES